MKEAGRTRAQNNANFKRTMQACKEASSDVRARVRATLDEERRESDVAIAKQIGETLTARLPRTFQEQDIDRLWREEQYVAKLPPLAIEVSDGVARLAYSNSWQQNHSRGDIKRHFQWAVYRHHPNVDVEWLT